MDRLKGFRPSGSMIVSIIALIAALSGTAFAAATISGSDLKNNTVASKKIKNKTLKKKDFSKKLLKSLSAKQGPQGPKGDQGNQGNQGPQGPKGENGASAIVRVTSLEPDTTGDGVTPPAWGERVSSGCGSGTGDASIDERNVVFNLPDDAGNDAVGVNYNGYNGQKLKDISYISYHAKYDQEGTDQHGGTPYFRIYTDDFAHGIIFSPNTQPGASINSGEWEKYVVTDGTVRYDDDAGNNPDISWDQLVADHGNETISQIRIQAGCGGAYTANTVARADELTVVVGGIKSEFNFGS